MTDISLRVRRNCGMCKNTIEKAANKVEGVANAIWDIEKKKIFMSFDETKIDVLATHNAIAASGYDTEMVIESEDAYESFPDCCKYDNEMVMNQSGESGEDHSNRAH